MMSKVGRPTKYRPEYCDRLVEYFSAEPSVPTLEKGERPFVIFPTFEEFASDIDVHVETMINWCDEHTEFFEAYKKAKQLQKKFLMQMGLNGVYNPAAFCFVAKNCTDMRDKQEVEHTGLPQIPPQIEVVLKNATDKK